MTDRDVSNEQIDPVEYLGSVFEPSNRLAILIRNGRRKETVQRITTATKICERSFQEWLRYKNGREGFDVYVGMNPLKPNARTRTKEDILAVRHLYVDLDHNGTASLAAIKHSGAVPTPNYVLSTSPEKYQVIWSVEEIFQEQAERLLRLMAKNFEGDPAATDSTRVLRLPGFLNRKYEAEFMVKAQRYSERLNHLGDFKLRVEYADAPHQPTRRPSNLRPNESRPLTQSEHDWAFAKRVLARGADPEEVIRRIARFREGEKHNPLDYARRTVTKALYALQGHDETSTPDNGPNDDSPSSSERGMTGT
jgi:hypothetical protein